MHREGASVELYIKDAFSRKVLDGIVRNGGSLEEGLKKKADLMNFELNGEGEKADKLRKDGWKVIGGSKLCDRLEMDRSWGVQVAKQYGIKVPKTVEFKNIDEAIGYIKQTKKPLAIKIDNNKSKASSYVAKSQEDMLDYITYHKEEGLINAHTFILQDIIKAADISPDCWFSSGSPCFSSNSTFEVKKIIAG